MSPSHLSLLLLFALVGYSYGGAVYFNSSTFCPSICDFSNGTFWIGGVAPTANDDAYVIDFAGLSAFNVTVNSLTLSNADVELDYVTITNSFDSDSSYTHIYYLYVGNILLKNGSTVVLHSGHIQTNKIEIDLSSQINVLVDFIITSPIIVNNGSLILESLGSLRIYGDLYSFNLLSFEDIDFKSNNNHRISISNNIYTSNESSITYGYVGNNPDKTLEIIVMTWNGTRFGNDFELVHAHDTKTVAVYGPNSLTLVYKVPDPSKPKWNWQWYYILAIVVGALVLLVAIIFIIKKLCCAKREKYQAV